MFDKDFQNPRTFTATVGYEREIGAGRAAGLSYTHARTDHLTRFFNANDAVFGEALAHGRWPPAAQRHRQPDRGAEQRQVAVQRSHRRAAAHRWIRLQFQVNYTLSFDKSDDDNERDPFTFRYARADSLQRGVQLERPRPAAPFQCLGARGPAGRLLPQ